MSGFVATADVADTTIANDGWWPNVDMAAARAAMRLDGTVTGARLKPALIAAIYAVADDLADWRAQQQAAGYDTLEDVPAPKVDDTSRNVALYLRAVYCTAHADLIERYRNFDTVEPTTARTEGEQKVDMIDDQRRNARWAVRDILGVGRSTVELI